MRRAIVRAQLEQIASITASVGDTGVRRSETRWRGASLALRSLAGWTPALGSGRSDTPKRERDRLAARSFDAYRNHLIGRAAVTRVRTNVVGTGLQMHPDVDFETLGISEDQADKLNSQISSEWRLYYDDPTEVDIEATLDGYGLQTVALLTALLGGDCFASTPYIERQGGIYGLKIQLVDPARVSNQNDGPDTATLQDGVEIALDGSPIAVHIRSRHPDDRFVLGIDKWERRDIFGPSGARRILQIWNDKDRIGTTRGVPYLAPILEPLLQLEQYSRAELMAAVVASLFTVFIKKTQQLVDDRGNPLPAIEGQTTKAGEASNLVLGSGAVLDLAAGEEAQMVDPTRPNANYDPFFGSMVKQIGASLEIPLDELLLHYAASYSAARAAMLQAWRFYSMRRWWMVQQFCQPHYRLWFDEAVARGRIDVTDYNDRGRRAAYQNAMWVGPARGAMDESQEASAAKTRIETGISNEAIEIAQMQGETWSTVYNQRKRELKKRRADGMELGPAPGQASTPGAPARRSGQTEPPPAEQPPPAEDDEG